MPDNERYFLYARKSTDDKDRQVRSIEDQISELRQIAERDSLIVVEELLEKQTAKKPGRPIFNAMIDRIEAGEATGILAWHADRLARNSLDGGRIIYLFDTKKLRRLQFYGGWVENTPQGKMLLNTEFGFSKYYIDSLSENVKRGHRAKVARGECPSLASVGYLNDHRTKQIVVDRDRAPIIREAYKRYAAGRETIDSLRQFFGDRGILTQGNKRWKGGKLISRTAISVILTNPIYYGHFRWSGEVHQGSHEPIITKALFDKAQEVLEQRWRWSSAEKYRSPKPYLGLLRCAECGSAISAEIQKGHTYYRCTRKKKMYQRCRQPFIREEALDAQISSLLPRFALRSDWAAQMLKRLDDELLQNDESSANEIGLKRAEGERLNSRLRRLKEALLDGLIHTEEYREEQAKTMSLRKTLEDQITALTTGNRAWLEPFKEWISTAQTVGEVALNGSFANKKALAVQIYGSNLVLEQKKARGEAVKPWAILGENELSIDVAHVFDLARTFFRDNHPS